VIEKGVLTGCDERYEWLLKWWWENYSKHNAYPITFVDFGMSPSARKWCAQKGTILTLTVETLCAQNWIKTTTPYALEKRNIWYAKIFALIQTPYQKTAWIDIDCEVKKNIAPLFELCENPSGVAIAKEHASRAQAEQTFALIPPEAMSYNCGVIAYTHSSPLIREWVQKARTHHTEFFADQQLFNTLVHQKHYTVFELPSIYNQIHPNPNHEDVVIYHHASYSGQLELLENYRLKNV
jgi:hypothetical protein